MRARLGAFALALALAACGPSTQTASSAAAPVSGAPAALALAPAKPNPFPQWLELANQAGGGKVSYHPASIEREADKSAANIWVEVTYGDEQTYVIEDKTMKQTITYTRERILFRFDCNNGKYAILERRLMGAGDDAAETIKTPIRSERDWRMSNDGGVTAVALGPACKADIRAPG